MRKTILFYVLLFFTVLAVLVIFFPIEVHGQTDNTVHVKSFPGITVGAKMAAAMATCPPSSAGLCIVQLDPSLASYATGTIPALCGNCVLADYRSGLPIGVPNGFQYITTVNGLAAANSSLAATGGVMFQTTQTALSSIQQIGATHYPVQWNFTTAQGPVKVATGGGIQLCDSSQMIGPTTFQPSGGASPLAPGNIQVVTGASVADVIAPCLNDNTQEAMGITNLTVLDSGSTGISITGTVTSGLNTITGASSVAGMRPGNLVTGSAFLTGTMIASISGSTITLTQNAIANSSAATIQGAMMDVSGVFSGTVLRSVSGEQVQGGIGLLLDGGIYSTGGNAGKPALETDIEVDGYRFWGSTPNPSGVPVVAVWAAPGTVGGAGIYRVTLNDGDVEACDPGIPCMSINGFSGANGGGNVAGIQGRGLDIEAAHSAMAGMNGLYIADSHNVEMLGINSEAPGTQTGPVLDNNAAAAVVINETHPGSTTQVHVQGFNQSWPTTVIDWVRAQDFASLNTSVSASCSSIVVTGVPAGTKAPLAGQPIEIMDGQLTEIVYAAVGTGTGATFTIASPGCKNAHSTASNPAPVIVWNPIILAGPGPNGLYQGQETVSAGAVVNDGTGVVTVTVSGDNSEWAQHHIGEWISMSSSGGDVADLGNGPEQIIGLGAYCTLSGSQHTCASNQFQYKVATAASYTNVNAMGIFADVRSSFDYTSSGDSFRSTYGPGNYLPELLGPVEIRNGASPVSLGVDNYDSDNHALYSKIFFAPGNLLPYSNSSPNDFFVEGECKTASSITVPCPPVHFGTGNGDNQNVYFRANGTDYFFLSASDGQFHAATGNAVLATKLTGTTGTITGTSLSGSCDSGTASVTGAVVGHPVSVATTTGADIGGAFNIRGSVTSTNTVTVYVCGTGTPSSLAYNVTVW